MIDFAALALGPGIAAFGRPVTVTPPTSNPPVAPFAATGVWSARHTNVELLQGETVNSVDLTLGIRLSEWPVEPRKRMEIRVPAHLSMPDEGTLWIDAVNRDGQGGATLVLKRERPGA